MRSIIVRVSSELRPVRFHLVGCPVEPMYFRTPAARPSRKEFTKASHRDLQAPSWQPMGGTAHPGATGGHSPNCKPLPVAWLLSSLPSSH
jgi:hypothetical protein